MIRYTLKCDREHSFESWFASAEGFERLRAEGRLACALCGSADVAKSLMAPALQASREPPDAAAKGALSTAASELETALAALRRQVEENSDYVGLNFAAEARAMHDGALPERPIHGEARLEEARALLEDGVPVAPLPFLPRRKTN
ncbi:DUF1178 family protein [Phaeovulum sp.]|uniref:DUF1178 family protein n=1 Tax=Phaeovulum sp. TaxID=2934796 RepID=UPI002731186B|nr:DUF1178 family protein [Phaeovulum sp.]MDP1667413.1 DUF1178 family protein [Phaeovulum sp.]MDP2064307.1 DUF1178 family protein [Phaeovulum sp.]MDP3861321.1 DUF1178 family protein [Phaeovulum sp.]MDZ4119930.1 DUF1178 family protein [Phaeovulum sp.]